MVWGCRLKVEVVAFKVYGFRLRDRVDGGQPQGALAPLLACLPRPEGWGCAFEV